MVVDAKVFAVFVATSRVSDSAEGQPRVVSHWRCHIAKQQISPHKAMFHIMDGSCVAFDAGCVVAPGHEITLRPRAEFQNDVQAMNRVDRPFKWMVAYFVMTSDASDGDLRGAEPDGESDREPDLASDRDSEASPQQEESDDSPTSDDGDPADMEHGRCQITRTARPGRRAAQGRPLGLIAAWLAQRRCPAFPAKALRLRACQPAFAERAAARQPLEQLPDAEALLREERPLRD
ncbi:unnamed protein product [Prorocentrum cordatum]|uniref:Uncharacterized protein n=1 Tax=Prorocentrum cordatum TaxID=2364126 RepID=A0ABN9ST62_9DINO|nr:unnamed protein product [Polarella glacialis]